MTKSIEVNCFNWTDDEKAYFRKELINILKSLPLEWFHASIQIRNTGFQIEIENMFEWFCDEDEKQKAHEELEKIEVLISLLISLGSIIGKANDVNAGTINRIHVARTALFKRLHAEINSTPIYGKDIFIAIGNLK